MGRSGHTASELGAILEAVTPRFRSFVVGAFALASSALLWSCHEERISVGSTSGVTSGAGGIAATSSAGGIEASGGGGSGGTMAPPPPTLLGLEANPLHGGDGDPTPAEQLLAELTTYAAGVRSVTVAVSWSEVDEPAGLDELAARIAELKQRGLEVVVVLQVVDHRADGRPERLRDAPWDDPETSGALVSMGEAIVQRAGAEVSTLVLGDGVDAYTASHPQEAVPIAALLGGVVGKLAAGAAPRPRLAIGLTYKGPAVDAVAGQLAQVGDASAFFYAANMGEPSIPNASSPTKDLDAMVSLAAGRPIHLTGVSFTSAASLGASADAQALRLAAFFSALEPRKGSFRTVNVARLHDLTEVACSHLAARQGLAIDAPEITFRCASGLRDVTGTAKLSWQTFLEASAAYAPP
jgi:hypothetical protein